MSRIIIVGAGLFGSVAAATLEKAGHEVLVIDGGKTGAASAASACLMKPSWMTKLPKETLSIGMKHLDSLYGVQEITFKVNGLVPAKVFHVSPHKILWPPERIIRENVTFIGDGMVTTDHNEYEGPVLCAAGVWSAELLQIGEMTRLTGAGLRFTGEHDPYIKPYAPYKQAVAFTIRPGVSWFGDGSSILEKNWAPEHVERSKKRADEYCGLSSEHMLSCIVGMRPYLPKHPNGLFAQIYNHTWVATGGAKNGTILAGYFATQFAQAIGEQT